MRLKFVSEEKVLQMGTDDGFDASIIEISGLGVPEKKYNTTRYVDMPGQITVSASVLPREISIKGDIRIAKSMPIGAYHIFFLNGGELYIFTQRGKKKIAYNPKSFKTGQKNGDFVSFELCIICDFPYFSDSVNNAYRIYKRIDKITDDFILPAVFTERVTEADIINSGQVDAEPLIKIECTKQGVYSGGIRLYNALTQKELKLDVNLSLGEIIEIDVNKRTVSSNMRQNCFGVLSQNCVLSEFVLGKGINHISLFNQNDGETVSCSISFDNLYAEAI